MEIIAHIWTRARVAAGDTVQPGVSVDLRSVWQIFEVIKQMWRKGLFSSSTSNHKVLHLVHNTEIALTKD